METWQDCSFEQDLASIRNGSHTLRLSTDKINKRSCAILIVLAGALASVSNAMTLGQSSSPPPQAAITIEGTVRNSARQPVADTVVQLADKDHLEPMVTKTKADGTYAFVLRRTGVYTVKAEKSGFRESMSDSIVLSAGEKKHVDLILESLTTAHSSPSDATKSSSSSPGTMEFDDLPNFVVAGITDRANAGGHGSDTSLRTSEALAKETIALASSGAGGIATSASEGGVKRLASRESENKLRANLAQAPGSFEANHQLGEFYFASEKYKEAIVLLAAAYGISPGNHANAYDLALAYQASGDFERAREQVRKMLASSDGADEHRLLGDLDERLGDPLEAVREFEQAVRQDASEQNYFAWGAELLLHGAVRPAVEVFTRGTSAHPRSSRMLTGFGAALYASGSFDAAARRLCEASDLKPADPTPYLFLAKMEKAAPAPLPCSEEKLKRFAAEQPGNALANYYYAMSLSKREKGPENSAGWQQAEALLEKAVAIDPQLGEAYLQLGILYSRRGAFEQAIRAYERATEASPQLSEAHYRLALAYKRKGAEAKSRQEFQVNEQILKAETAAIERQRRELMHFMVILKEQSATPPPR